MEKRLLCQIPFVHTLVFEDRLEGCCGDWCSFKVPIQNNSIENAWNSKEYEEFRQSILDGSYRFCNDKCPYLGDVRKGTAVVSGSLAGCFAMDHPELQKTRLRHIKYCSDYSCNLRCNTCRDFPLNSFSRGILFEQIHELENSKLTEGIERIDMLGSGDPFASATVRMWMKEFRPELYPSLKEIHLHTNAQLWTEKLWESLPESFRKLVTSAEISIDAATEKTYESIRRGGRWKKLVENLQFISKIEQLKCINFSFTIQRMNSEEIVPFYNFLKDLENQSNRYYWWDVRYSPAEKWPAISQEHYDRINVRTDPDKMKQIQKDLEYLHSIDPSRIHTAL